MIVDSWPMWISPWQETADTSTTPCVGAFSNWTRLTPGFVFGCLPTFWQSCWERWWQNKNHQILETDILAHPFSDILFDFEQQVGPGRLMAIANFVLAAWLLACFEDFSGIGFWRIPDFVDEFWITNWTAHFQLSCFCLQEAIPILKVTFFGWLSGTLFVWHLEYKLFGMRLWYSDYCFCKQHALPCKSRDALWVNIEKSVRLLSSIDWLLLTVEGITLIQDQEKTIHENKFPTRRLVHPDPWLPKSYQYCEHDGLFNFPTHVLLLQPGNGASLFVDIICCICCFQVTIAPVDFQPAQEPPSQCQNCLTPCI